MSQRPDQARSPSARNPRDLGETAGVRDRGTGIALGSLVSRAVVLLACSTTLMGCIVTRDLDYEPPPNYPPSVRGSDTTPSNVAYIVTPDDEPTGADAGVAGAMELTLSAIVRDPNVDQALEGWLFVNRNPNNPDSFDFARQVTISPNSPGQLERRTPDLIVPFGALTQSCNIVELRVSGTFGDFPALPVDEAFDEVPDLGVATWFVGVRDSDASPTDPVDLTPCISP